MSEYDARVKVIKKEKVDFIVPERIRQACILREYTYKEAAEKCEMNYKEFGTYANGHKDVPKEMIFNLMKGLNFPKNFFYWVEWTRT